MFLAAIQFVLFCYEANIELSFNSLTLIINIGIGKENKYYILLCLYEHKLNKEKKLVDKFLGYEVINIENLIGLLQMEYFTKSLS